MRQETINQLSQAAIAGDTFPASSRARRPAPQPK